MSPTSSFRLGRGIGLVSESTLAVLEPVNAGLAQQLWELVVGGAGIDELLERLSTTGLRALGAFAMAQFEGDEVRVVVRGEAGAVIGSGTDAREITARSVLTWHEEVVEGASAVHLFLGTPLASSDRLSFRVGSGLVPTDGLRRDPHESLDLRPTDVDALAGASAADVFLVDESATPALEAPVTVAEPAPAADDDPAPVVGDEPVAVEDDEAVVEAANVPESAPPTPPAPRDPATTRMVEEYLDEPAAAPQEAAAPVPDAPVAAEAAEAEVDDYDQIWGRTMARSVQAAAVHQAADPEQHPAPPSAAAPSPVAPSPVAAGPVAPASPPPLDPATPLIHSVPGAGHSAAPVTPMAPLAPMAPSGSGAAALGDHDGRTMTKAQIQAMRAAAAGGGAGAAGPSGPTMGGPTVQALVCPGQHANPPQLSRCRVCGQALSAAPVVISRPTLGVLRFSNGTSAALDKPALIGRNPKLEGALPSEVPSIVRLDVGQGLSRTHASVRLEGWQVLLEDLNSANGTIVQLPGREARRLHPGEPVLLEHGTTVDFGGEITCVVELT